MGKKKKNDEESFNTPFKLNKRLFLGRYRDLNFSSNKSITISFTINVKQNYSNWVNIMLISNKSFSWNVRKPGIWLWPNKCALNICRSTDYSWNEGMMDYSFPMNKDVHFRIIYDAGNKEILVYENNIYKTKTTCKGNFTPILSDDTVWVAANSFGENALISKFSIEGGIYKPIR